VKLNVTRTGLVMLAVVSAGAILSAQPAPTKIAIINIQGAISATKDGEKAREAMKVKFESRAKDMEARRAEIEKKRDQLNKGANTMSPEQREKLTRDIDDASKKFQWDTEDLQNDYQTEEGKLVNEIGQKMMQVIDGYAKQGGYMLVLDVSAQQSPVLWAAQGIEITLDIVKLYDAKYAGAAATTGPSTLTPSSNPGNPGARPVVAPPAAAPKRPAPTTPPAK
jgi:outer membrane protein